MKQVAKHQTRMRVRRAMLLGLCCYSVAVMAQDKISAEDLAFIEELGSLDEDQETLQAAMAAYSKNKSAQPTPQTSTKSKSSTTDATPSGKKAGARP